jgi:hypothetical protein
MQTSVHQCTFSPLTIACLSLCSLSLLLDTGKLLENHLNQISSWQSDLYECKNEFQRVLAKFTAKDNTPKNRSYIAHLEKFKVDFQETVNNLYLNLGLVKEYPSLAAVDANFVKTLLLCRDKKIEVQKAATSVLNEMFCQRLTEPLSHRLMWRGLEQGSKS